MTLFALIRHGVTDWNLEGRLQGGQETPLNAQGRELIAMRRLPPELATFDRISSPMLRCRESADLLFRGAPYRIEPRLREMSWGAWEGQRREDLRADPSTGFQEQEALGLDLTPPGGESPRQVQQRLLAVTQDIARAGRPTLAIAHRGVLRALLCLATGWDMMGKPPIKLDWTAAHIFRLDERGWPAVERVNVSLEA